MVNSRIMADEQESAPDEPAGAESGIALDDEAQAGTGIGPEEGPESEAPREPIESQAAEVDSGEAGCPIQMGHLGGHPRCGRKLHVAPQGIDDEPVCLMHSKDPDKQT